MDNRTTSTTGNLARRHAESWMFLLEATRDPRATGAVAPSSRALARALAEPVRVREGRPLSILEVGAGTGAVTRELIRHLSAGSRLDVAEANPRFAAHLRNLVATHPQLVGNAEQVQVHPRRVEDLKHRRGYDVIVSGLPFANFTCHQVRTIMGRYLELLHPGGTLTYFAYLGTRTTRALLVSRAQVRRQRAVVEVLARYQSRYASTSCTVWANLPPARVWQVRRPAAVPVPQTSAPVPGRTPASGRSRAVGGGR